MFNYLNSFVGYAGGVVSVNMYRWDKQYKAGQWICFWIKSDLKLTKVFYMWEDGKKRKVKTLFNKRLLWVKIPPFEKAPELKIVTEVEFPDGEKMEHTHRFIINNMK